MIRRALIVAALTGVPAGRFVDRFGAQRMSTIGLIAMVAGAGVMPMLPTSFGIPGYIAPLVAITAGYAVFQAANNTAVMTSIQPDQRGATSGMLNLSRNLGLITGASVMGAVFAFGTAMDGAMTTHAEAVVAGMRITFVAAEVLIVVALGIAVGSATLSRRLP